ncbi:MAG TPA: RNA polymerase sigma factor [Actinomycetota bacterium]|nr:RNA polymerase sigma factor [Actinomycetota bacterium]
MNDGSEAQVPTFEEAWLDLRPRLDRLLSRCLAPRDRDDVKQETALRLYASWDRVDHDQPLWSLVSTIALNIIRDRARRASGREINTAIPDMAGAGDVEASGLARVELHRVLEAMNALPDHQRAVLLAEIGGPQLLDRNEPATRVLRMRARRRLHALLEAASASALIGPIKVAAIRLRDGVATRLRWVAADTVLAPAAALVIIGVLSTGTHSVDQPIAHPGPPPFNVAVRAHPVDARDRVESLGSAANASMRDLRGAGGSQPRYGRHFSPRGDRPLRVGTSDDAYAQADGRIKVLGIGFWIGDQESGAPVCFYTSRRSTFLCKRPQTFQMRVGEQESGAPACVYTTPEDSFLCEGGPGRTEDDSVEAHVKARAAGQEVEARACLDRTLTCDDETRAPFGWEFPHRDG